MTDAVTTTAIDPGAFGERVLGRPLWPHQLELARSTARFRVVCAGRQVGKSAALAVIALHEAMTRRNVFILLISAGEVASQRLLRECVTLATSSDLMRGSVVDSSNSTLEMSNGSRIMSVPASEKQIRGWPVDLLIVDEAAFVSDALWEAAVATIVARPGSRVILTSTPFGVDHFFRRMWQRGMNAPDASYQSWHWPSETSPLIDSATLEQIRQTVSPISFEREYMAEWADESGMLLSPDEISRAVLDYELIDPDLVHRHRQWVNRNYLAGVEKTHESPTVVGGVDWGKQRDAQALVLLAALDDNGENVKHTTADGGDHVFFIPWLEYHYRMDYGVFVDRLVEVAKQYNLGMLASEVNGVGEYPTEELARRIDRAAVNRELARPDQRLWLSPVWTDARRKQSMFGRLKGMLQQGQLMLPAHPELLKQLGSLEMVEMASGSVSISVPDRVGHDDLAMALGQALSCVGSISRHPRQRYFPRPTDRPDEEVETLGSGVRVPLPVRMLEPENVKGTFVAAHGTERETPW